VGFHLNGLFPWAVLTESLSREIPFTKKFAKRKNRSFMHSNTITVDPITKNQFFSFFQLDPTIVGKDNAFFADSSGFELI
jgi:hypothetical protein